MRIHPTLRLLALGAAAAAVLAPYAADSGTCANAAARDLLATSYADAIINSPKGEDTNFFIKAGGVPNIMLLLDNSGSMNRLPPDGPCSFGSKLPPGYVGGDSNQTTAFAATATTAVPKYTGTGWTSPVTNTRVVGCGLDPVSAANADFTGSSMYQELESRRFYPPCGRSVDGTLLAASYNPTDVNPAPDYAANALGCEYLDQGSNNVKTDKPGFDPDFYDPGDPMGIIFSAKNLYFGRDLVFHDNPDRGSAPWARSSTSAFGHNFGDGFNSQGLWPHTDKATGNRSTITSFCDQQEAVLPATLQTQGGLTHAQICKECLVKKGWYYDGVIYNASEYNAPTPSIWYTGNYLNFFPPKFLLARKVLKDVIASQTRVRMAISVLGGGVIQDFKPNCKDNENSNFDSSRSTYAKAIDGVSFSPNNSTPLAVSLFDVARFYHSPDLPWFGKTWEKTNTAGNIWESSSTKSDLAVCYACQTSSVIVFTDGQPTSPDGSGLPSAGLSTADLGSNKKAGDSTTGIQGIKKAVCPECVAFGTDSAPDYRDSLAKVAFYMQNMDLRTDAEATLDCKGNQGKQVLDTYTIGFATKSIPSAATILANAAKVGGGMFVPAENTLALKEGFNAIIEEINGRSTSFSVATVSTLQTMSGRAVHVPRFSPGKTAHWQGHLFRYDLYSEFVNGCTKFGPDDYNCDGRCDGSFLMDKDGDFISEDANGAFVKNDPPNKPTCQQAPRCGASCAVAGSAAAVPYWDGANAWGYLPDDTNPWWKRRNIWTAVDGDLDGDIEAVEKGDKMVKLEATDAAAAAILPYLALGGGTVCGQVSARFATAGDLASSALVSTNQLECAKSIIRYVLGADLFNERGLDDTKYPPASQDQAKDRAYILGDIFHSSPVTVKPPLSAHNVLCEMGLENQCLPSLWDTQTLDAEKGYTEWQESANYHDRRRIALVGANDGMLHAFNDGRWLANADDPLSPGLDERQLKPPGYYESGALDGANELWGFVPPDLLNKLPLLLGSEHQLYVDGTAMVRDVWVDGTKNGYASGTYNDVKEPGEFHTVAVTGERRGGTRFFALDVTDATEPGTVPRFLWIYPQPGSKESITFGETYDDLLPTPPPIGPVRVATGVAPYPTTANSLIYKADGSNTLYHETWIAFLNGGYDPQYVRGRGVHMVDVWTGKEIFDFSYPDNPASVSADDPRLNLRFPIPSAVGMVQWGTAESMPEAFAPDGSDSYFDTANFGDAGGQVWTLRFHKPAKLDTNGLATNWFGARLLQMGGQTGCKLCGGQPFFNIVAHLYTPSRRYLRAYLGTGDRFNLTDKYGGTCSPTNIRACVMRGCTVTVTQASNLLSAPGPGYAQRGLSEAACGAMTNSSLDGPAATCTVDGKAKIEITNCPSPDPNTAATATTKDTSMHCVELTDGYQCTRVSAIQGTTLSLSNTANVPTVGNWFFSLRVFAESDKRTVFTDAAGAKLYDANRLWVTQNGATVAGTPYLDLIPSTSMLGNGTEDGQGWGIYFWHTPTVTITDPVAGPTTVNVDWKDERVASGTAADSLLVAWNTVMPPTSAVTASSTGSCSVSRCTMEDRRVNFLYGADPVTGAASGLFLDANGNMVRSSASYRLVPAQALQHTYFVNAQGQVQQAMVGVSPEEGAISMGATAPEDPVSEGGSIILDKELYQCRHADSPVCK